MTVMKKKKQGRKRLIELVLSTILLRHQSAQLYGFIGLTGTLRGPLAFIDLGGQVCISL